MSGKLISNVAPLVQAQSENDMFPSCMRSALGALGDDPAFDFLFFAGVCGDLFTQVWSEPKWQYNDFVSNIPDCRAEPVRLAFAACGYEYDFVTRGEIQSDKASCVRRIVDAIDRGFPVLTFGIVGPPVCTVICGYAENGNVLVGRSQFTDETAQGDDLIVDQTVSKDYFQKRNGLDGSHGLLFFGRRTACPTVAESIRESILRIPAYASMPVPAHIRLGQRAFEAWAESLLCDADFTDDASLESPLDTYMSCVVLEGTNMHYMNAYLDRALSLCPDIAPEIEQRRCLFLCEKEAFDKLTQMQGGYFFENDRRALLNPSFRRAVAAQVREVGRLHKEARADLY